MEIKATNFNYSTLDGRNCMNSDLMETINQYVALDQTDPISTTF